MLINEIVVLGLQLICCFNQVTPFIVHVFRFSLNLDLIGSFKAADLLSVEDLGTCMPVNDVPGSWVFNLYVASIK